jgi:hypothetical protein
MLEEMIYYEVQYQEGTNVDRQKLTLTHLHRHFCHLNIFYFI